MLKLSLFACRIAEFETASYTTCFVVGYFDVKSLMIHRVDGLIMVEERILMFPFCAAISSSFALMVLSAFIQVVGPPSAIGFFKRAVSYKESTDA